MVTGSPAASVIEIALIAAANVSASAVLAAAVKLTVAAADNANAPLILCLMVNVFAPAVKVEAVIAPDSTTVAPVVTRLHTLKLSSLNVVSRSSGASSVPSA